MEAALRTAVLTATPTLATLLGVLVAARALRSAARPAPAMTAQAAQRPRAGLIRPRMG